jgi:hypothetical protein
LTASTGMGCDYAHGAGELRREAAVQLQLFPPRYKTYLCDAYLAGRCVRSQCLAAGMS